MIAGVGGEFGKGGVEERGCVVPVVCEGDESMKAGLSRSTDTVSVLPFNTRVKYLPFLSRTRNGPSYTACCYRKFCEIDYHEQVGLAVPAWWLSAARHMKLGLE